MSFFPLCCVFSVRPSVLCFGPRQQLAMDLGVPQFCATSVKPEMTRTAEGSPETNRGLLYSSRRFDSSLGDVADFQAVVFPLFAMNVFPLIPIVAG